MIARVTGGQDITDSVTSLLQNGKIKEMIYATTYGSTTTRSEPND